MTEALEWIDAQAGRKFDPGGVGAFQAIYPGIDLPLLESEE